MNVKEYFLRTQNNSIKIYLWVQVLYIYIKNTNIFLYKVQQSSSIVY